MQDQLIILNLVYDGKHEILRLGYLLLEDVSWRLVKASLLARIHLVHDLGELNTLDDLTQAARYDALLPGEICHVRFCLLDMHLGLLPSQNRANWTTCLFLRAQRGPIGCDTEKLLFLFFIIITEFFLRIMLQILHFLLLKLRKKVGLLRRFYFLSVWGEWIHYLCVNAHALLHGK